MIEIIRGKLLVTKFIFLQLRLPENLRCALAGCIPLSHDLFFKVQIDMRNAAEKLIIHTGRIANGR